jgi:uncharacterized membrane protein YqjE
MMSDRLHVDVENGATDLTTEPKRPEMSLGELFSEMTSDVSTLFRKEIELAKVEAKDELSKAGKGAGMFGGAGLAAWLTLLFLSLALMFALANGMDEGWAALIVAVIWAVVAAVLAVLGRSKLRQATPPMQETKETLKEDAQWARRQTS